MTVFSRFQYLEITQNSVTECWIFGFVKSIHTQALIEPVPGRQSMVQNLIRGQIGVHTKICVFYIKIVHFMLGGNFEIQFGNILSRF